MFLEEIRTFLEEKKKHNNYYKNIIVDPNNLLENLPIKVGSGAGENILLKDDTAVELGSPQTASCAFIVLINFTHLIDDGKITLIGPDISESDGKALDFGQVLLIGGSNLTDEQYKPLERAQYIGDQIEGFMIRTVPQKLWCRISKNVIKKGFSFEVLGKALMHIYKTKFPLIEKMEVIFVTSNRKDVEELDLIAKKVRAKYSKLFQKEMKARIERIRTDCDNPWECSTCPDQETCDEIEDMLRLSKNGLKDQNTGETS
ncbi:MAG: carbon monoxide dehydrogenase [Candidatus Helarchaeota archaeon]